MSKRIVLHIGIHKTGSSSIQSVMAGNINRLKQRDIHYPLLSEQWGLQNHSLLCFAALSKKGYWYINKYMPHFPGKDLESVKKQAYRELEDIFKRHADGVLVLSAEELSVIGDYGASRLTELVHQYFDEVTVLAYVREPMSWLRSLVCGQVRRGKRLQALYENLPTPDYKKRLNPFVKHFGNDLTIRLFDRDRLYRGCVVADFLHCLGEDDRFYDSLDLTGVGSNAGNGRLALLVLDKVNGVLDDLRLSAAVKSYVRYVLLFLLKPMGGKFDMPSDVKEKYSRVTKDDWSWVCEQVKSGADK